MVEYVGLSKWIVYFYIYSFIGWCIESFIVSVTNKRLTNRGFLKGPMLPIYGFGAIFILISTLWVRDNFVLVFICGMLAATLLEYVTGVAMENMFGVRYWDYSNRKFQFQGHICLISSLFWGFLSVVLVCFIHIPIAQFVDMRPQWQINAVDAVISVVFIVDTVFAFKNALDFKKLLLYEEKIRQELAQATEHFAQVKELFREKIERGQDKLEQEAAEYFAKVENMLIEKKAEFEKINAKSNALRERLKKNFPTASSIFSRENDFISKIKKIMK